MENLPENLSENLSEMIYNQVNFETNAALFGFNANDLAPLGTRTSAGETCDGQDAEST